MVVWVCLWIEESSRLCKIICIRKGGIVSRASDLVLGRGCYQSFTVHEKGDLAIQRRKRNEHSRKETWAMEEE